MKKILIIEDDEFWQEGFSEYLPDNEITILQALTIEEAERLFAENPDLDLIVLDILVPDEETKPGERINTVPLLEKIRQTFRGPILAISNESFWIDCLVREGCSHSLTGKSQAPDEIKAILGL